MRDYIILTVSRQLLASIAIIALLACAGCVHRSPGTLYESSTEALTPYQLQLRDELQRDVEQLSVDIGPRNAAGSIRTILEAEQWVVDRLAESGIEAELEEVAINGPQNVANVVVTLGGDERSEEILVIGAHYDTVSRSPGANDNTSGVALLLATAERLRDERLGRTVRIVFFVNEEAPFGFGLMMGSRVHAEQSRARGDSVVAMIAVDSVGNYTSEPGSQNYPPFIFGLPSVGNFVAFVSNRDNQQLVDRVVELFQTESRFPSIGVATDMKEAARSDHAPFWWQGYPAMMMSDTSERRDPNYHQPTDTADNLNYEEMARMADGFIRTVKVLASVDTPLR
jgi:Zn-dependent M28 family amino/carboxypeptidase